MSNIYDCLGPEGWGAYEVTFAQGGPEFFRVYKPSSAILVPAFVDIHIHGAYGVDVMSATQEELLTLCRSLERDGYDTFLPTTITAGPDAIRRVLDRLPDHPLISGFHLEGPFLSPQYPGAQPENLIAEIPDGPSEWDEILQDPRLKVITLAPEIPRALELILRLQTRGVVVSMGHTNATFEEAKQGFEFGATHATHMFNAMRPFHHREAGMVGYALEEPSLTTEFIYDRKHMTKEAAQLLIQCKPPDRLVAVSDCTMAAGLAPGTKLEMWGHSCICGQGDVRLINGALAGSAQTLLDIFRNLYTDFGPEVAVRTCSINPRARLGLDPLPKTYLEFGHDLSLRRRIPC